MAQIRYTKNLFLRGMCIIYLFAFTSLYIQIPGLYGNNGILPARAQMDSKDTTLAAKIHHKPTLLWLAPYIGLDTEYMMDVLALLGMFLAFTGFVSQKFCTAPTFAGLWSLYYSLYQVGQTFMWFQWDILLLEAGCLTLFVAPVTYRPPSRKKGIASSPTDNIAFCMVRWLLFRLMYSSGIVKLTSGCPSWWGLDALYVHLESMCIPTPLSWYTHHLPQWILRLSTVIASVTEMILPWLFFIPMRDVRITGFFLQVFLQIGIILTGNFNFFNLLTITLCLSLLDDDFFFKPHVKGGTKMWQKVSSKIITAILYGSVAYATWVYYSLHLTDKYTIESKIAFSKTEFDRMLGQALPISVYLGFSSLAVVILRAIVRSVVESHGTLGKLFTLSKTLLYSIAAMFIFGISLVPHATLHPVGNTTTNALIREWYGKVDHLHIANAYGLFRRMTGVGGRPEVIIEGSNHFDGPWREFHFLYKPGNVNSTLPFVAPHQPRLDWQMWFASLGTYHQNPWLMSLAYRILTAQPEVLALMDQARSPFPNKPPKYLRANLYTYHYSPWSHRNGPAWWTREKVGEYFPVFYKEHPPLVDYLKNLRIIPDTEKDIAARKAVNPILRYVLDHLRNLYSHVEPSILIWSIFTAGCALIFTTTKK